MCERETRFIVTTLYMYIYIYFTGEASVSPWWKKNQTNSWGSLDMSSIDSISKKIHFDGFYSKNNFGGRDGGSAQTFLWSVKNHTDVFLRVNLCPSIVRNPLADDNPTPPQISLSRKRPITSRMKYFSISHAAYSTAGSSWTWHLFCILIEHSLN